MDGSIKGLAVFANNANQESEVKIEEEPVSWWEKVKHSALYGNKQKAEAAKSFAVFQKNPDLANFLLNLNAMELSLKSRATLIFDQHTQPFNLFQGYSTNLTNPK